MVAMSSGLIMEPGHSRNLPSLLRHMTSLTNPSPAPSATSASRSISLASVSSEGSIESGVIDPDDILSLTHEVRSFKDALGNLRKVVPASERSESLRIDAHEKLAEVLKVLRFILEKYPALQSTELLVSAGTLIHLVKGYTFEDEDADIKEFHDTVDQLSQAFSSRVSEYLMGDLDTAVLASSAQVQTKAKSTDDLASVRESPGRDRSDTLRRSPSVQTEDLDNVLLAVDQGVEIALHRAKLWSRHAREIANFVERRTQLETEHAKALSKLAQGVRATLKHDSHLAFQSVYITALDQEIDNATATQASCSLLSGHKFVEPLTTRRAEHEKCRKLIKEAWRRELKRMQEAVAIMRKAQVQYVQRHAEWEKAKEAWLKAENSELDASKTEKRRKMEDDALQKAVESEATYRAAVAEANERHSSLVATKRKVLQEIRELIVLGDQTLKAVSVAYFQLQQATTATPPVQFQTLCETSRLYEPGSQYSDFLRRFPKQHRDTNSSYESVIRSEPFSFELYGGERATASLLDKERSSRGSISMESSEESSAGSSSGIRSTGSERLAAPFSPINAWGPSTGGVSHVPSGAGLYSDTESVGSSHSARSREGSPPASPMMPARRLVNTSQDEIENDGDPGENCQTTEGHPSDRNPTMSKAACSHTFKKLKTPARCRECDSYVYFQGAECMECGLAAHKKCLEVLAIQCGHKRLPRKMTTFGVDLAQHLAEVGSGPIPRLLIKCVNEIEARGLQINGLYRVSGVKSKVEKLCQAFENGADLVDLTEVHPNIIANVLKLYLRQLPEPLLTSKLYPDFVKLAKDCSNTENLQPVLDDLRDLCRRLPKHHLPTLAYLMRHLKRVAEQSDVNKMPPSNLGIVFGPTLLRTAESATIHCLIDTVQQSRIIELLITYCDHVFGLEVPQERLMKIRDESKSGKGPKRSNSFSEKKKRNFEEMVLPGFVVDKPKISSSLNDSNYGLDDQRSSPSSEDDIADFLHDEAIPFRRSPKNLKGTEPPKIFRSSLRDYHGLEGGSLNLLGDEERSPEGRKASSASQPGTPHQKLSFEFPPRSPSNQSTGLSKSKSSLSSMEDAPKSASSLYDSSVENEPITRVYTSLNHERRNQFFGIIGATQSLTQECVTSQTESTTVQSVTHTETRFSSAETRLSVAQTASFSNSPSPCKSTDEIYHSAEDLDYDSEKRNDERKIATVSAPFTSGDENRVKIQVPGLHIHNIPIPSATIYENYRLQKSLSQLSASDLKTKYTVVSVQDKPSTTVLNASASNLYRFRTEASRMQRTPSLQTEVDRKMSETKPLDGRVEKFV